MIRILAIVLALCLVSRVEAAKPRTKTLLIVKASQRTKANEAVVEAVGPKGAGTFHVPYVLGSGATITHYIAAWDMDDDTYAKVAAALGKKLTGTNKAQVLKEKKSGEPGAGEFKGRPTEKLKAMNLKPKKQK